MGAGRLVFRNWASFTPQNENERALPFREDVLDVLSGMCEVRTPLGNEPMFVAAIPRVLLQIGGSLYTQKTPLKSPF